MDEAPARKGPQTSPAGRIASVAGMAALLRSRFWRRCASAINGEHNRRTLSRILAQPIYRDALLMGKFLAGLATLGISLAALWLLVIGLGLILLGVPPGGEEVARSLVFLVVAVFYAGVWLALAMLLSILFRSPATAVLVALGIWLFLTILWPMLAPALAQLIAPQDPRYALRRRGRGPSRACRRTIFLASRCWRSWRRRRGRSARCFSSSCAVP
jgi:ABC-type transport system involved in multi-copper enzyme maturation permease subunit